MSLPENVLTEEEIESTAAAPGRDTSPWFAWAPSVLGATILWHVRRERDLRRALSRMVDTFGSGGMEMTEDEDAAWQHAADILAKHRKEDEQ